MNYYEHPFCSNSALTKLNRELLGIPEPELYEAYRFGSLFDAVVTEPEKLDLIQGLIIGTEYTFTSQEYRVCKLMKASFIADPLGAALMTPGWTTQHEVYSSLALTHNGIAFTLDFKGKFDFFNAAMRMVTDLKSTTATTEKGFIAACERFQYWRQMVAYMLLSGSNRAMLIGVSKAAPHRVFKAFVNRGDERWRIGLAQLSELSFKYYLTKST